MPRGDGRTVHVIRAGALGDVLWTEPVLRALASRHDRVVLHSRFGALFGGYDLANVAFRDRLSAPEKLALDLRATVGSTVRVIDLDMSYERTPKMHVLHAYQDAAGLPRSREYPRLPLPSRAAMPPTAVLHLEDFTGRNFRSVHGVDWAAVVAHLRARGLDVVQVGVKPSAIPGARTVKTSIPELVTLVAHGALFVGIDSGPSHIAAAFGRAAVLFFGAVNPDFRHFRELFRGTILQQPCEYAGCYHETVSIDGTTCRLVGDAGIPKCSLHTTAAVIAAIDATPREPAPR